MRGQDSYAMKPWSMKQAKFCLLFSRLQKWIVPDVTSSIRVMEVLVRDTFIDLCHSISEFYIALQVRIDRMHGNEFSPPKT